MKNFQDIIKTIGGFAVIALFIILFVFIWTGSVLALKLLTSDIALIALIYVLDGALDE